MHISAYQNAKKFAQNYCVNLENKKINVQIGDIHDKKLEKNIRDTIVKIKEAV